MFPSTICIKEFHMIGESGIGFCEDHSAWRMKGNGKVWWEGWRRAFLTWQHRALERHKTTKECEGTKLEYHDLNDPGDSKLTAEGGERTTAKLDNCFYYGTEEMHGALNSFNLELGNRKKDKKNEKAQG